MTPLEFKEEHITPISLARNLGVTIQAVLDSLEGEKGLFQDKIDEKSILAWSSVSKVCKAKGFEAVDKFEEPQSVKISPEERVVLKEAAKFHREYGKMVHDISTRVDPASAEALLKYHTENAEAIESVLERSQAKKRTTPEMGMM